jgi:hypothetical protein
MFPDAVKYSLIHICNGNISTKWFLYRKLRMKIVLICLVLIFVCVWSFVLLYKDLNNWIRRLCIYILMCFPYLLHRLSLQLNMTWASLYLFLNTFYFLSIDCTFVWLILYLIVFSFTVCLGREALCSLIQYICYCWHIKLVASKSFICKFFFESHTCRCLS